MLCDLSACVILFAGDLCACVPQVSNIELTLCECGLVAAAVAQELRLLRYCPGANAGGGPRPNFGLRWLLWPCHGVLSTNIWGHFWRHQRRGAHLRKNRNRQRQMESPLAGSCGIITMGSAVAAGLVRASTASV